MLDGFSRHVRILEVYNKVLKYVMCFVNILKLLNYKLNICNLN